MLLARVIDDVAVVLAIRRFEGRIEPHDFVEGRVGTRIDLFKLELVQIVIDVAEDGTAQSLEATIILIELAVGCHPIECAVVFDGCVTGNDATLFTDSGEAEDVVAADIGLDEQVVVG